MCLFYSLRKLESVCDTTQVTPIHVAVESANYEMIQEMLVCGVKLNYADKNGENVFHYAAKLQDSKILQVTFCYT